MIEIGTLGPILTGDPARQQCDLKSERPEQCGERTVQFIAEAATVFLDNFVDDCIFIQHDGSRTRNVQVLERHRFQMAAVKKA
jgi:hypothetical protein